jgi:hypothetical protein
LPAVRGDLAVLRVQPDDDVASERAARVLQEAWILHRRSADDDVRQAVVQIALDGFQVTDAAAQLHGNLAAHLVEDRADRVAVPRLAGKRAVQIDQMQPSCAAIDPMSGHRCRIF